MGEVYDAAKSNAFVADDALPLSDENHKDDSMQKRHDPVSWIYISWLNLHHLLSFVLQILIRVILSK